MTPSLDFQFLIKKFSATGKSFQLFLFIFTGELETPPSVTVDQAHLQHCATLRYINVLNNNNNNNNNNNLVTNSHIFIYWCRMQH